LKSDEVKEATGKGGALTFYDSNSGKPLFIAPRGRDMESFLKESFKHGWPSFRDEEVVWDNVRILPGGESVSVDGTHLGHNIPDITGNRHCINLVSVAGRPTGSEISTSAQKSEEKSNE
jgi:peptide methionine sulfoxide reductase MsrB